MHVVSTSRSLHVDMQDDLFALSHTQVVFILVRFATSDLLPGEEDCLGLCCMATPGHKLVAWHCSGGATSVPVLRLLTLDKQHHPSRHRESHPGSMYSTGNTLATTALQVPLKNCSYHRPLGNHVSQRQKTQHSILTTFVAHNLPLAEPIGARH